MDIRDLPLSTIMALQIEELYRIYYGAFDKEAKGIFMDLTGGYFATRGYLSNAAPDNIRLTLLLINPEHRNNPLTMLLFS